jgi:hypothetical protein
LVYFFFAAFFAGFFAAFFAAFLVAILPILPSDKTSSLQHAAEQLTKV